MSWLNDVTNVDMEVSPAAAMRTFGRRGSGEKSARRPTPSVSASVTQKRGVQISVPEDPETVGVNYDEDMTEVNMLRELEDACKVIICPICLEVFEHPEVLDCGHSFCRACIQSALHEKNSCPCCQRTCATSRENERLTASVPALKELLIELRLCQSLLGAQIGKFPRGGGADVTSERLRLRQEKERAVVFSRCTIGGASTIGGRSSDQLEPTQQLPAIVVGDLVFVSARTWPGINKPGGAGRVTRISVDPDSSEPVYSIKYFLGGEDHLVPHSFVQLKEFQEERASRRGSRSAAKGAGEPQGVVAFSGTAARRPSSGQIQGQGQWQGQGQGQGQGKGKGKGKGAGQSGTSRKVGMLDLGGVAVPSSDSGSAYKTMPMESLSSLTGSGLSGPHSTTSRNSDLMPSDHASVPAGQLSAPNAASFSGGGAAAPLAPTYTDNSTTAIASAFATTVASGPAVAGATPGLSVKSVMVSSVRVTLLCTSLAEDDGQYLNKFLVAFGEQGQGLVRYETHLGPSVTHLVVGVSTERELQLKCRTMKYLHALMSGLWILSPQWLVDCLKAKCLLPEGLYEVQSSPRARKKKAPCRAREEVRTHGSSRLFDRYVVVLQGDFPGPLSPTKKDLTELLTAGRCSLVGSIDELLHERYHGKNRVIIFGWAGDPEGRTAGANQVQNFVGKAVPVVHYNWVIDCIDSYHPLNPIDYYHEKVVV